MLAGEEVMSTREKKGPSKESSLVKPCRQQPASQNRRCARLCLLHGEEVAGSRRGSELVQKGPWVLVDSCKRVVRGRKSYKCNERCQKRKRGSPLLAP